MCEAIANIGSIVTFHGQVQSAEVEANVRRKALNAAIKSGGFDTQDYEVDRDTLIIASAIGSTGWILVVTNDIVAKLATSFSSEWSPRRVVIEHGDLITKSCQFIVAK